ncbi:MAG: NADH-quinone oxidoreductase subunit L, partial [Verrucomicrobiota bacterium]
AYHHNSTLFVVATIVAALTAFYMFRLFFVAFLGAPKSEASDHAHESPAVMTLPLQFLAVLSVIGGLIGIDTFIAKFFKPEVYSLSFAERIFAPFGHAPLPALFGIFAAVVGFSLAWSLYAQATRDPLPEKLGALSTLMRNKFYFDEVYRGLIAITHEAIAKLVDAIDRWIIAGFIVRGAHGTTELFGRGLRLVQTGNLQTYAFLFVAGVAVVLYFVLFRS